MSVPLTVDPQTPTRSRPLAPTPINPLFQRIVWSALILIIVGIVGLFVRQQWTLVVKQRETAKLDRFNTIPDFELIERSGQPFRSAESLRGKVWVANFFFTSCPGPCLAMNAQMAKVQEAITRKNDQVRLVSFTVYPEHDTPEALRIYADRFQARQGTWYFLTGDKPTIYNLAHKDFMLGVTDAATGEEKLSEGEFVHSTKLALVDRRGVVRGYFDSTSPEAFQRLLVAIGDVLREQPAS